MTNLKNILDNKISCKSVWFMRQAGRYLPEFRKIREKNKDFIKLCLNTDLSSEITLQPVIRFNLDSAIIFSDILMVPHALGQNVNFIKNQGPKLSNFNLEFFLNVNEKEFSKKLDPVYTAIHITRKKLEKKKSLIAFIGAPWTLLVYMLDIKNSENKINFNKIKSWNSKLNEIFDMRPYAIEQRFNLRSPIYSETAAYGHMGRNPEKINKEFTAADGSKINVEVELFPWEKLDYVEKIKSSFGH